MLSKKSPPLLVVSHVSPVEGFRGGEVRGHSPVCWVAKRMTRATTMMKSKETTAIRATSRGVQRGFLADLGVLLSVMVSTSPCAANCMESPEKHVNAPSTDFDKRTDIWMDRQTDQTSDRPPIHWITNQPTDLPTNPAIDDTGASESPRLVALLKIRQFQIKTSNNRCYFHSVQSVRWVRQRVSVSILTRRQAVRHWERTDFY